MTLYVWFVVAMLAQVTGGRTQLLAMRGNIVDTSGLLAGFIGIAGGISFFALILWGFATLPWYFVLSAILIMGLLSGFIVNLKSFVFWYRTRALVDFIATAITVYIWWNYWPF